MVDVRVAFAADEVAVEDRLADKIADEDWATAPRTKGRTMNAVQKNIL